MEFITPTDITPGTTGAWVDVDVSSYVSAAATGIVLRFIKNDTSSTSRAIGCRKNGSTDNRTNVLCYTPAGHNVYMAVGVDANKIVEIYVGANVNVQIVAYFEDDAVFFTNGIDKSLDTVDTWIDIDISGDTGADTAIAAIFENIGGSVDHHGGQRNNGSTDGLNGDPGAHAGCIIGVDENEICEGKIDNTDVDFFLLGYIKSDSIFYVNRVEYGVGVTETWTDTSPLPSGAEGGYFQAGGNNRGIRKNGSTEDYHDGAYHSMGCITVECDANKIVELWVKYTYFKFYLVGYPGKKVISLSESGSGEETIGVAVQITIGDTGVGVEAVSQELTEIIQKISIKRESDGFDFSQYVDWQSVTLENNLTSKADVLKFKTRKFGSITFVPQVNDEIGLYENEVKIFGGHIVKVTKEVEGKKVLVYKVEAKDYTYLMDKKLVKETYEDTLVEDIITDIVSNYLPSGFTTNNVASTGITLKYIMFDYEEPSKCFQRLAEMIGYDWYVDENKDIHFFSKEEGETAPFNLTDTGTPVYKDLVIREDQKQIKNVIYVRGGEYVGDLRTDKVGAGDGETKVFKLPYRYDEKPSVTVGGVSQTVGIDFLDSEDDYDCLWNYQEKIIRFKTAPASGDDIEVTGYPLIPVLIKAQDTSSISKYGEREFRIIDKTIKTKEAARRRAQAELTDYSLPIQEGSFIVYTSGLRAGQKINIQSDIRNINQDFIIDQVVMKTFSPTRFYYKVHITTSRTKGIIEYLKYQLEQIDKRIELPKYYQEILDVFLDLENIDQLSLEETFNINKNLVDLKNVDTLNTTESLLRAIKDSPPTWVAGPYAPVDDSDRKRPAFCDRSCLIVA